MTAPTGSRGSDLQPLVEATRGGMTESVHFGALAVVDSSGKLVASMGDPGAVMFPRSSAKPFQALPLIEAGGRDALGLTQAEIALTCASHLGTDAHVATLGRYHEKIGASEGDLGCGIHRPYHQPTAEAMLLRGEQATPFRHNCSGKHTGMLAFARLNGWPFDGYLDPDHPVQQKILATFAEMCGRDLGQMVVGTDGCSAPTFAVPLHNMALAYARLMDPSDLAPATRAACGTVTAAMWAEPEMVSGPGGFDTRLLMTCPGRVVSKGGAEGYQALGVTAGALGGGSPALGIAIKISDGDNTGRARRIAALEVLRQLGLLGENELGALSDFGPVTAILNQAQVHVGDLRPVFRLNI